MTKTKRSSRDKKILDSILSYWEAEGRAPTLEEIATGAGLIPPRNFKSSVYYTCRRLVSLGKLEEVDERFGTRRGYRVVGYEAE
jgi:hypothetical protein